MPRAKIITSFQNPQIKKVIRLRDRKEREDTGLMIVEGAREVLRAKEAQINFQELYICRDFLSRFMDDALLKSVEHNVTAVFELSKDIFSKISFGERREGIIAVCPQPQWTLNDFKLSQDPLVVVVEGIEKPGNLGAVLRTCDGAGVDGLLVCDAALDIYNPNAVRSSIGTIFSVPVISNSSGEILSFLKKNNLKICIASPQAKTIYTNVNFNIPLAVVVGSEQKGLSDFWKNRADVQAKIPMRGKADSLNVSATTAIFIYEVIRQRNA